MMISQLEKDNSIAASTGSALRLLDGVQPLYMLPEDPLVEEVLIPGFQVAESVDCMVGFFSSEVLASLAPGLASYIASSENSFRLIISPLLRAEDQAAIENGLKSEEEVAGQALDELMVTEDSLKKHTLKCLTWLLKAGRIEVKIALMKGALFHPKVWLFGNDGDVVAVHGSSNVTYSGIKKNIEQVAVSKSWQDTTQDQVGSKFEEKFAKLWEGNDSNAMVIKLPDAVKQSLLRTYSSESPPTEDELRRLYEQAAGVAEEQGPYEPITVPEVIFAIPDNLRYEDGPFAHQGKAVNAWCAAGFRGILEMATGSGKTITSMIAAHRLHSEHKPLLIVVSAPYVPLIEQWCDEIAEFGLKPINLTTVGGASKRAKELARIGRGLRTGTSGAEVVIVSHDTLCTNDFIGAVAKLDCERLLIADEAHNLGRAAFINNPPECFEYRLGLSATPVRQYDEEGTEALLDYFGQVVFSYTLEEAIGNCLVEYDYYLHPVYLTESEMQEWFDLTGQIKENAWKLDRGDPDNYLTKLLRDRRALLETASGKLLVMEELLDNEDARQLRHTLIYTSDKGPAQLNGVNKLLRRKNILFHQLTARETADRELTRRVIGEFQDGGIQVLTAKRVLDEGVNIPQICKAFILASTTVERQWVQRRGRLLRTCSAIGKTHSVIHDLVALPPEIDDGLDPDARSLVRSELRRAREFAKLARNAGRADGPLSMIDDMANAVLT